MGLMHAMVAMRRVGLRENKRLHGVGNERDSQQHGWEHTMNHIEHHMSSVTRGLVSALTSFALVAALVPMLALVPAQKAEAATAPTLTITRANTGKVTLKVGSSYKLKAKASSGATVTYKSSKKGVVKVTKKGVLKAQGVGKATVTVSAKKAGKATKKKVKVTVVEAEDYVKAKKVKVKVTADKPKTLSTVDVGDYPQHKLLTLGATAHITATVAPAEASNKNITFTSSDKKVLAVSADGTVTAKAAGTAAISFSVCGSLVSNFVEFTVTTGKLGSYSWAKIKKIADKISHAGSKSAALRIAKAYGLVGSSGKLTGGECKVITLTKPNGTKTRALVQILGFWHDNATGGGKAGITFGFKENVDYRYMNKDNSNSGGWKSSALRKYLNNKLYKRLPAKVRSYIVPVQKYTNNTGGKVGNNTSVVTATSDKLWLLSASEAYGTLSAVYNAEGTQYQLYSDNGVTKNSSLARSPGDNGSWLLRSPYVGASRGFHLASSWGCYSAGDDTAAFAYGVSPAFCF